MSVGITSIGGYNYTIGVAYVAMPSDLERGDYIRDCYKNLHISIVTEEGGFMNRVPISNEILNFIEFPKKATEFGSPIIYCTDDIRQHPFVLTKLSPKSELGDGKEHAFKFRRRLQNKAVEISGDVDRGNINIVLNSDDKAGFISIKLLNKNKDGKFSVDIGGDIVFQNTGLTQFIQQQSFEVVTIDPNDTKNQTSFKQDIEATELKAKKVLLNKGDNPIPKGNQLKSFLEDLIDEIASITVTTSIGQQPVLNKAKIIALKTKIDKILSEEFFIEK